MRFKLSNGEPIQFGDKTISLSGNSLIISSSTEGSSKKFQITVDDSGTLSATEVTDAS